MAHDMVSVYLGMFRGGNKSECVLYVSACMYVHTYVCMYVCLHLCIHVFACFVHCVCDCVYLCVPTVCIE